MARTLIRLFTAAAAAMLVGGMLLVVPVAAEGTAQTYVVVYSSSSVPSDASKRITAAGGSVIASYSKIGVVIASSSQTTFSTKVKADSRVTGAVASAPFATQLVNDTASADESAIEPPTPATDTDSLSGLQWDMNQIAAPQAHAISGGSRSIVVGDIDTGADYTHPDLAPNIDDSRSANCLSGVAVPGKVAANDDNGHGTHTAGTIAAASNGIGIVGVAPNVKIAAIKAGNADGFFFPEAVICAFMWVGDHKIPVTNNSYFADPWLFNCKNDPDQRAIWMAERRAIAYAQRNGDLVVAAMGNQADDLAHPTQDATSPDDTTPVLRDITNACAVVPTEVPGVVGVSATGPKGFKSFYSSYGIGVTDVAAPGGDSILQPTAAAPNGRVLSSWPAALLTVTCAAARRVVDASGATYCYQQGTSMASPHVAGVAALIASRGITSPGAIAAKLGATADPIACPSDLSIYDFFPALDGGAPQTCSGGPAFNAFTGQGQVNALSAVTN